MTSRDHLIAVLILSAGMAAAAAQAPAAQDTGVLLATPRDLAWKERLSFTVQRPAGASAFLLFEARIRLDGLESGSAPACMLTINGLPVSLERLRNKPPYYTYQAGQRVFWFDSGLSAWAFSYYPWGDTQAADGQANTFVLDIADLLRDGENDVTFESLYDYRADARLEFRAVRLLVTDDFARSPRMGEKIPPGESRGLEPFRRKARAWHSGIAAQLNTDIAYRPEIGVVAPREDFRQDYALDVSPAGRLTLRVNGDAYESTSRFMLPGLGWSAIGEAESARQWDRFEADADGVRCENRSLRLERRIVRRPSHVEIRDTVTNKGKDDLPVVFLNTVDVLSISEITEFRLGGVLQSRFYLCTSPMSGRLTAATPVAYLARQRSAVGVVIEDDCYRNQTTWMAWDSVLAAGDDMFYLPPESSYTFVWKLYPAAERSYYRLVNAVRRDWNLFQHIPGLFGFVQPQSQERMYESIRYTTPQAIAGFLEDTGIQITSAPSVRYSERDKALTMMYGNEPLPQLREGLGVFSDWRNKAREGGSKTACLPYLNVHLCRLTDGETLAGLAQRLPDSFATNAWDEPVPYRSGWLYCVVPTAENAVGRHLMDVLRLYMEEFRFDGIYLDEWDHSRARVSFAHSDGHSALLDEDGRIVRKIGFVPLLAKDFHVRFTEELVRRNAVIFANQFDDTLAAAQLPIIHFAEPVAYSTYLLNAAQVSRTPLSLHLKGRTSLFTNVREFLKRGVLTCYYWYYLHGDHVLKRCYPITVRELWPGCVIGDDRIITCASGTFSLKHDKPLRAYVYGGPDGVLQRTFDATRRSAEGHTVMDLALTDNEIAVIMEE